MAGDGVVTSGDNEMVMAHCTGCGKYKACSHHEGHPICQRCWPRRDSIVEAKGKGL